MSHTYYSQRTGTNPNLNGLPLKDTIDLFLRVFAQMEEDGYFHEAFGFWCVDAGHISCRVLGLMPQREAKSASVKTIRSAGMAS